MSNITLKLHDYLFGNCSHTSCIHNEGGICLCNKSDHLEEMIDYVESALDSKTSTLQNRDISCYAVEIKEGFCECGAELQEYIDRVPFGETVVDLTSYECPMCGE